MREAAFQCAYVTTREEREAVLITIVEEFDISVDEAEASLWADREEREVLVSPPRLSPTELLKQYNLSLTQTLLVDALELSFTVSGTYQQIFGPMGYLGLMYTFDHDLSVTVMGPAVLFKKTRKYRTTLARLVPNIIQADEWCVSAQVETEVSNERRVYDFSVDSSQNHLFPETAADESFDSEIERNFAARIIALAKGLDGQPRADHPPGEQPRDDPGLQLRARRLDVLPRDCGLLDVRVPRKEDREGPSG